MCTSLTELVIPRTGYNWVNMGKGNGMCKETCPEKDKQLYSSGINRVEIDQLRWRE